MKDAKITRQEINYRRGRRRRETPWGPAQHQVVIRGGVEVLLRFYSTASHGGYEICVAGRRLLGDELAAIKPFAGEGWYEEDCDWMILALGIPDAFEPAAVYRAVCAVRSQPTWISWARAAREWLDRGSTAAKRAQSIAERYYAESAVRYQKCWESFDPQRGCVARFSPLHGGRGIDVTLPAGHSLIGDVTLDEIEAAGGTIEMTEEKYEASRPMAQVG